MKHLLAFTMPRGELSTGKAAAKRSLESCASGTVSCVPSPFTLRPAFTLIEVLVASAVMATVSAGLLVTSWRLVGFAQDEAEHMVADGICHDVMWAVYSQSFSNITSVARFEVPLAKLPRLVTEGQAQPLYPLRRSADFPLPTCKIDVTSPTADQKEISVKVNWMTRDGEKTHELTVTRARAERQGRGL